MIPYGRQNINENDIEAVCAVLRSDFLTQGPAISHFEQKVADYCGVKHAVAVSNATAALHIACLALNLGAGDLAWTSPNTFVASANCIRYCNAAVDFVDIDSATWNMSVKSLAEKLAQAAAKERLPKILIPVHFSGQSCDMAAISALAKKYNIAIIEDASHAIGASFAGMKVGNCAFSECTVFSFHPVKIITTGEGGIITTNNDELADRLRRLRSHGITRDAHLMHEKNPSGWYYEQLELGFNYRMTDIQAALGISQMDRLDAFIERRSQLAARYANLLGNLPLTLPLQEAQSASSWHLYVVRLQLNKIKITHREIFDALRGKGIGVNLHYMPVYRQPYYQALGFKQGYCQAAENYYAEAISLPIYSSLKDEEQDYVIQTLRELLA